MKKPNPRTLQSKTRLMLLHHVIIIHSEVLKTWIARIHSASLTEKSHERHMWIITQFPREIDTCCLENSCLLFHTFSMPLTHYILFKQCYMCSCEFTRVRNAPSHIPHINNCLYIYIIDSWLWWFIFSKVLQKWQKQKKNKDEAHY